MSGTTSASKTITADANGKFFFTLPAAEQMVAFPINVSAVFEKDPNYDPSTGAGSSMNRPQSVGLGAGVAVGITMHTNNAFIKNGTIEASSISVTADSGSENDKLLAAAGSVAGCSQGDFGLAGAITVQVNSFKTRAIVGDTATLTLFGGSFTVKASSYEEIETKADANGPAKAGGSSAGVGAGIAVDVTGIDVAAIVADGVNIIQKNDAPLTKIEITVAHSGNEMMEAKAGSSRRHLHKPCGRADDFRRIYGSASWQRSKTDCKGRCACRSAKRARARDGRERFGGWRPRRGGRIIQHFHSE